MNGFAFFLHFEQKFFNFETSSHALKKKKKIKKKVKKRRHLEKRENTARKSVLLLSLLFGFVRSSSRVVTRVWEQKGNRDLVLGLKKKKE